jgi:hypothetical protein
MTYDISTANRYDRLLSILRTGKDPWRGHSYRKKEATRSRGEVKRAMLQKNRKAGVAKCNIKGCERIVPLPPGSLTARCREHNRLLAAKRLSKPHRCSTKGCQTVVYVRMNKCAPCSYDAIRALKKSSINFRLACLLRARLKGALKYNKKVGSAVRDLGCSLADLRAHLETQFQPGMTWENQGYRGWHIDHIRPLASFDLTDHEQVKLACHYTNLQPMWGVENMSKGAKWNG